MADTKKQTINISSGIIFRVVFVILFLIFLYLIRDIIMIFLFALIIASAVTPAVSVLNKIKIPRVIGALLVYILFFGILSFLFYLVVPSIAKDITTLTSNLPAYFEKLTTKFQSLRDHFSRYQPIFDQLTNYLNTIKQSLQSSAPKLFSGAMNIFGGFYSFVLVLVISFYLSVQKSGIQRTLTAIIPLQYRDYLLNLWERAQKKLGRWLQGQLFLGLIVGAMVYIGLYFLDIKFALLLAILAGVLEIFPYIGPVIAGIPAVIVGLLQAPILGFWVLILYIVVQQIENHLMVPLVVGKVVGLNPVTIILALLIGGKLGGIWGVILAVPFAAVFAEFLRDLIKKRKQEPTA
jgi:predicted PurR-regulated permease PerM